MKSKSVGKMTRAEEVANAIPLGRYGEINESNIYMCPIFGV